MRERPEFEDRSALHAEERGISTRAGVFLLEGSFRVANHGGRAERALLDRGALLVATLAFDPGDARRRVSGGASRPPSVRPADLLRVDPREAVSAARPVPSRN